MKKITNTAELKKVILQLEERRGEEWALLKGQFTTTVESIRPASILKNSLEEFTTSPTLKEELVISALELAGGFISQKLERQSHSTVANMLRMAVVSTIKSPDALKSMAGFILSIFSKEERNNVLEKCSKEEVL